MNADRAPLVRRAVQVVALAACVAAAYAAALAIGTVVAQREAWLLAAFLVAVVVVVARPLIDRLAERVAFGRTGDPNAAMREFLGRMSDAMAVDDVLPHLARTAAQAVRSPHSEVHVWLADGGEWRQTWPPDSATHDAVERLELPLQHGGDSVGRLDLAAASDDLAATDRALLERLAGPAGVAVSNVRLAFELREQLTRELAHTAELRRSRERLVAARQDQRLRFAAAVRARVDRHLGDADTALRAVALEAEPERSAAALAVAHAQVSTALEALRELVRGVYPAALTDRGLRAALLLAVSGQSGPVIVEAADERCPEMIEAAAYFCAMAMIDEVIGGGPGRVAAAVDRPALQLRVSVSGAGTVSPTTAELLRDRVAAFGGELHLDESESVVVLPLSAAVPGQREYGGAL